jgi:chromate transporter
MSDGEQGLRRPETLAELFWAFNRLALQGFGGVLAVAQRELVERLRWMTREQFLEVLSVGQVLPGPNIINMGLMIGDRWFGTRGAIAALSGLMLVPLVIVIAAAVLYGHFATLPPVAGALRGMGAVAAGLVISTAVKLVPTLRGNALGRPLAAAFALATLLAIGGLRWPLPAVVLGLGVVSATLAWWRLGRTKDAT